MDSFYLLFFILNIVCSTFLAIITLPDFTIKVEEKNKITSKVKWHLLLLVLFCIISIINFYGNYKNNSIKMQKRKNIVFSERPRLKIYAIIDNDTSKNNYYKLDTLSLEIKNIGVRTARVIGGFISTEYLQNLDSPFYKPMFFISCIDGENNETIAKPFYFNISIFKGIIFYQPYVYIKIHYRDDIFNLDLIWVLILKLKYKGSLNRLSYVIDANKNEQNQVKNYFYIKKVRIPSELKNVLSQSLGSNY